MNSPLQENPQSPRLANLLGIPEVQSKAGRLNPFPAYAVLRQSTPIRFDPVRGCWDIFRYDDIQTVFHDAATFSSKRHIGVDQESLITTDPPRHTHLRALISKSFTPKIINDLAPHIQTLTEELLQPALSTGQMDIVQTLAFPLPIIVIAELLGVPTKDRQLFKDWSDTIVKGPDQLTPEAVQKVILERQRVYQEMVQYFQQVITERKQNPQKDLISMLLEAEVDNQRLSETELLGFCILLLIAGNETTTNLITNSMRYLVENPAMQDQLREDPTLIPKFVEEVLRYYPPVLGLGRYATRDVTIGGQLIQAGQQVFCWMASGNRDSAKFANSETFVVDRTPNPHLSFGFGVHFCIGAPLARLEAKILLGLVLGSMKNIRLAPGADLTPLTAAVMFSVKELPVVFDVDGQP